MTNPIWSSKARRDLLSQVGWIGARNPAAAIETRNVIDSRANWLVEFPKAGAIVEGSTARSFRVLRTNYVIVYRPRRDTIEILRVHHIRQSWRPR